MNSDAPMPFWNTATSTPYAAPIDSRFMITAFNGTSSDRNTTSSNRNDSSSTTPMKIGSRASSSALTSSNAAVMPPTCACRPVPAVADGSTSLRR